jgi:putative CocE/NonD family hydrolase
MRRGAFFTAIFGLTTLISAAALMGQQTMVHWDAAKLSKPQYKVLMEHNVPVKMRDGVCLSTDIYIPNAPGKFPTILSRTPYSNNDAGSVAQCKWYAERGYAVVTQDVRGKYDSEGRYTLFRDEALDGYDTVEWIGAQPWSNAKVGMIGGSYGGYVQIAQGILNNKYLTALAASVTASNIFNNWIYIDGTLFLSFAVGWGAVDMDGRVMQYGPAYDWPAVYRHLPLVTIDRAASHANPGFRELLKHPRANDPFWNGISFENEVSKIAVPFLVVSGWYDIFLRGALEDDIAIRTESKSELARKNKRLMIGPWTHFTGVRNNNPDLPKTGPERGIDFGPNAEVGLSNVYLRWHDCWLKGISNGVESEPPIKIFVMGENYWRYEYEWPLARTKYTKYYIHSTGKANSASGKGTLSTTPPTGDPATDSFTYDPSSPVPTLGGNLLDCLGCNSVSSGPVNQVKAEMRNDVLVYTSAVLNEAVEVTGPITVKLFASTSAKDTDWTAKLVDVHPDGYAQNIQDGIIRARYRDGKEAPASLLKPGKVYEYDIDLWATSNTFLPGHRIRLDISSSNFPRFDRNLNTGEDPMTGIKMEKARQIIYHSPQYPSHVVLPIIPRTATNRSIH